MRARVYARATCVDCGKDHIACHMWGRAGARRCQGCYHEAVKSGRYIPVVNHTYHVNGVQVTKEIFEEMSK